jgi:hypothetical protein
MKRQLCNSLAHKWVATSAEFVATRSLATPTHDDEAVMNGAPK